MAERAPIAAETGGPSQDAGDDETARVPGLDVSAATVGIGATVSRYVVLAEVGRGGMGRVLRAYDPKLQREVALKEVRSDVLDVEATQRLVAEARAMAKLSHPNVVAIYDVELVSSDHVVLVMEFVAGCTLKQWLAERPRDWQDVVRRFVDAGRGLHAAHQAGLLHRDFKPANVLVASADQTDATTLRTEQSIVKVTDFGIAKASMSRPSLDSSQSSEYSVDELTKAGSVMGTPRYMAPEQHRGQDLTAAADQYAFCIALWEALCGESPFGANATAETKLAGPPPWRGSKAPRPIVDAIVRGLAPRPQDRWPSMADLLLALDGGAGRKRTRRFAALGAVTVSGLALVAYQAWTQQRAERCSGAQQQISEVWSEDARARVQQSFAAIAKPYAHHAQVHVEETLDGYARAWAQMHTEACEATTVRAEQSPQMMDLRMACLHGASIDLRSVIDVLGDADSKVVQKAHELVGSLRPLARCADTEALAADVEPPDVSEADAVEQVQGRLAEARARLNAGRYSAAKEAVEQARTQLEGVEYGPVHIELALADGHVLEKLGDYPAAEAALTDALRLASKWRQWTAMRTAATDLLLVVGARERRMEDALRLLPVAEGLTQGDAQAEGRLRAGVAMVLDAQGKHAEAEQEARAGLALLEKALGSDHREVAGVHNNLATVLYHLGNAPEAAVEYRAALAIWEVALSPDHPLIALVRANLANMLYTQALYPDAEAEYRKALTAVEAALGADHSYAAKVRANLGGALAAQDKYSDAEVELRAALRIQEAALGPDHPDVAKAHDQVGEALVGLGRFSEAEAEHRRAIAAMEASLEADHPFMASARNNLGRALFAQGKFAEAESQHRNALVAQEAAFGTTHPDVAITRDRLATALSAQGKLVEAEVERRAALTISETSHGSDHLNVAIIRASLAGLLLDLERNQEALALVELAWSHYQHGDQGSPQDRADAAFVLARARWQMSDEANERAQARRLAEDALRTYRAAGPARRPDADEVQAWITSHS